jgi:hypothetical protein
MRRRIEFRNAIDYGRRRSRGCIDKRPYDGTDGRADHKRTHDGTNGRAHRNADGKAVRHCYAATDADEFAGAHVEPDRSPDRISDADADADTDAGADSHCDAHGVRHHHTVLGAIETCTRDYFP